jgi:dCMP deaminase
MVKRVSWDRYFMSIAEAVATRSTCLRRQVGAVAVKDKHILATGYNGAPEGIIHCEETSCVRTIMNIPSGDMLDKCMAVHAEQNVICMAAKLGISLKGATLYSTVFPCSICAKMIINAGIKTIVYDNSYADSFADEFIKRIEKRPLR